MSVERRVVAESGGAKGAKRCQLAWVDPHGLEALGNVCGFGADKYAPTNYRQGYDWSLSLNALERHVLAVKKGEWTDPESGEPHLAHAAWHCLTLIGFSVEHPEFNDLRGGPAERKDAAPTTQSMSQIMRLLEESEQKTIPDLEGRDVK